ncbi:MAG: hypothetical protein M3068_13440 [Gemmatimonadota bacterium]|nr:hypothetical protein [Gemmatimonadota bacterium]
MSRAVTVGVVALGGRLGMAQGDTAALPRYDFTVTLQPAVRRIEVSGTIRLPASPVPRDSVAIALSERFPDLHVEVLAPTESAGEARLSAVVRPYSRPGWGTTGWHIRPVQPIPAGEPVVLRFSYSGAGDLSAFVFSIGATSFGAGITTAWYPELEEAEPHPAGRLRGLRAMGEVSFVVPPPIVVHATGRPVGSAADSARGIYRFSVERPTYFSFAAGRYVVMPGALPVSAEGRTLPTAAYFLRRRPMAREYARRALQVLRVLEREFGRYPFDRFAIVEVPAADAERAGFAGASVDGFILSTPAFLDQPFNTAYYGHEISHQWWGVTVRPTGARGVWMLSEGMAQYGSLRAVEALDGAEQARRYRTADYPGYFDLGGGIYFRLAGAHHDAALADLPADDALSRLLADSKGFLVWDVLAQEVGRDRFRATLANVVRLYTTRRITWDEFLGEVSRGAGRDLGWFYRQWFDRPGAPDWRMERLERVGDSVHVLVAQDTPSYRVRVPVRLSGTGCPRELRWVELDGARTLVVLPARCRVDSLVMDATHDVIHWTPALRAEASALQPYTEAQLAYTYGRDDAERLAREALARVSATDSAGLRLRLHLLLSQMVTDAGRHDDARREITAALASVPRPPDLVPLVYLQLARVARAQGDGVALRKAVAATIRADRAVHNHTGAGALAGALLPE